MFYLVIDQRLNWNKPFSCNVQTGVQASDHVTAIVPSKIVKARVSKQTDNASERKIQTNQKSFLRNAVLNYLNPKPSRQELSVPNV